MTASPAPDAWSVQTRLAHSASTLTVVVSGRLGTEGAAEVRSALAAVASGGGHVQVDLAGVDYISSAGLAVLREVSSALKDAGGSLEIVNASEIVSLALHLAGGL